MSFSDADVIAHFNHFLSGVASTPAATPPTRLDVGLTSTTPTEGGGNINEPTDGAYTRIDSGSAWEVLAAPPRFRNTAIVGPFPTMGADFTATHAVLFDQAGVFRGAFTLNGGAGYLIPAGAPFSIAAQAMVADGTNG